MFCEPKEKRGNTINQSMDVSDENEAKTENKKTK